MRETFKFLVTVDAEWHDSVPRHIIQEEAYKLVRSLPGKDIDEDIHIYVPGYEDGNVWMFVLDVKST